MPSDYYPDDSAADESSGMDAPESKGADTETALIPKSLLAGKDFKPGEEVVFKIVHMYDDEVEVEYATGEEKDDKKSAMSESMDDMDKMAAPKGY